VPKYLNGPLVLLAFCVNSVPVLRYRIVQWIIIDTSIWCSFRRNRQKITE